MYALHNALTSYPLKGWKKYFSWLLQPFCQCQYKNAIYKADVCLLDVQVALKDGCWYGSHGLVWYDVKLLDLLDHISLLNKNFNDKTYLRLGYDHHFGNKKDLTEFQALVKYIQRTYHGTIILYEYFIEKPWSLTTLISLPIFERYWSLTWAKAQIKEHWWKFYLLLPFPRLWTKLYKKQWLQEFQTSGKEIFMTDFV